MRQGALDLSRQRQSDGGRARPVSMVQCTNSFGGFSPRRTLAARSARSFPGALWNPQSTVQTVARPTPAAKRATAFTAWGLVPGSELLSTVKRWEPACRRRAEAPLCRAAKGKEALLSMRKSEKSQKLPRLSLTTEQAKRISPQQARLRPMCCPAVAPAGPPQFAPDRMTMDRPCRNAVRGPS